MLHRYKLKRITERLLRRIGFSKNKAVKIASNLFK